MLLVSGPKLLLKKLSWDAHSLGQCFYTQTFRKNEMWCLWRATSFHHLLPSADSIQSQNLIHVMHLVINYSNQSIGRKTLTCQSDFTTWWGVAACSLKSHQPPPWAPDSAEYNSCSGSGNFKTRSSILPLESLMSLAQGGVWASIFLLSSSRAQMWVTYVTRVENHSSGTTWNKLKQN